MKEKEDKRETGEGKKSQIISKVRQMGGGRNKKGTRRRGVLRRTRRYTRSFLTR